jgi:DNA-binding transcriptional LysR family regulator
MQFESLKVFCDVVRCKSFSQAAQANGLTQSAASQIVLQLEKRLGKDLGEDVRLIDRSTRPLQLTPAGQIYYDGCKGLVEQYLELEAAVRNAHAQVATTVQVAAIYSVGLGDMGQFVERFAKLHPNVKVHVDYLHPDRVVEKVLDGSADFGLMSFPPRTRDLVSLSWREEEMVLTCAPTHPLAGRRTIAPEELAGVKYVGFDRGLVIRREVDRFLREHGVAVEPALEFDNIETIKKAVEVSAVVALLPEPTVRKEVSAGALVAVPLEGEKFVRPLGIIHRRSARLSSTALRFIQLLRQPPGGGDWGPEAHCYANGAAEGPAREPAHRRNGHARGRKKTG